MRLLHAALLPVLLGGAIACGQPVPTSADLTARADQKPQATADPVPPETPAVVSLAGEWRVAGIDGRSVDGPVALSLTGDDKQLWWQPRCAGIARTYRIDGRAISFGPTEPPLPAGSPPPPVCAIGLPPGLQNVVRALDDAVSVARTPNNGVLISGPDHSLTLFSQ